MKKKYHKIKRMVKDISGFSERIYECALFPETSCEEGNRLLDRAMLAGTLDKHDTRLRAGGKGKWPSG
ncbi:MAG: hypothetical protein Q8O04_02205 [Deltaproteobacteria bacterium]|nr:hypothetical protein [Deltaproteobacteria bacterium]